MPVARWPDRDERLTPIEARLLEHLAQHAGRIVPRQELLTEVWGYHPASRTKTVGVIVRRLRRKIEPAPDQPTILRTIRGKGWTLVADDQPGTAESNVVPGRGRFFGREKERARVQDGGSLVAVTGPPGIGKTRLTREIACDWSTDSGVRQVVWIPVDGLDTAEHLVARVALALGVVLKQADQGTARVGAAIAGRGRIHLVLDGADAAHGVLAPVLDAWLDAAPLARFVVTSRNRPTVRGCRTVDLGPLSPAAAQALLTDRVEDRGAPIDDTTGLVALVERLQGIPLALELAAARSRLYDLTTLARELSSAIAKDALEPVEAAVAWTCARLSPSERSALAQMAVFRGGFDLEAARVVVDLSEPAATSVPSVDRALTSLLDWSLVMRVAPAGPGSPARFDILDSIRSGHGGGPPSAAVRARHARYFARFGDDAFQRSLHREGGLARGAALLAELSNLRLATTHPDSEAAAACARAVASLTNRVGPMDQGVQALQSVLERPDLPVDAAYRTRVAFARSLVHVGRHADAQRELASLDTEEAPTELWEVWRRNVVTALTRRIAPENAVTAARAALDAATSLGDPKELSIAEGNLANALMATGAVDEATALQHRSLQHATEAGDVRGQAYARALIATWALQRDAPDALELLLAARDEAESIGDQQTVGWLMTSVITALRLAKRTDEAIEAAEDAIRLHESLGSSAIGAVCRGNLASIFADLDEPEEAIALFEQALPPLRKAGWVAAEASFLCGLSEARIQAVAPSERRGSEVGLAEVDAALEMLGDSGPPVQRALAWLQRASVALHHGDVDTARKAFERSDREAGGVKQMTLTRTRAALVERLQETRET